MYFSFYSVIYNYYWDLWSGLILTKRTKWSALIHREKSYSKMRSIDKCACVNNNAKTSSNCPHFTNSPSLSGHLVNKMNSNLRWTHQINVSIAIWSLLDHHQQFELLGWLRKTQSRAFCHIGRSSSETVDSLNPNQGGTGNYIIYKSKLL